MKIAICNKIDFKPEKNDVASHKLLVTGFENVDLTAHEVAEHINLGYVICAQHHSRRKKENFLCSGFIAVDIDYGWRMEELLALPYVKEHAAIVYTTASHTAQAHRLRIVFELERVITDPAELTRAYQGIILYFEGDKACDTPCQMFYGSKGSNPIVIGKTLVNAELDRLIQLGHDAADVKTSEVAAEGIDVSGNLETGQNECDTAQRSTRIMCSRIALRRNEQLKTEEGSFQNIAYLAKRASVHCPHHADKNASAFIVENKVGIKGVHCRSCKQTFWPEGHALAALMEYDFFEFERHIDTLEYEDDPATYLDETAPKEYWAPEMRSVQRLNQQYLADFPLQKGSIFVLSPKNSGKTKRLEKIVIQCKEQGKSVLLIGHRQLLLGEMARKLGLHYYKDKISECKGDDRYELFRYLAICIDSMPHLLNPRIHQYDVVIIDESEQVFAHMTSKTLRDKRRPCYLKMEFFIREAQSVVACDADLGFVTVNTIEHMRVGTDPTKLYVNGHKATGATVDLYESEKQLITEMMWTVMAGGQHYICCNSKEKAKLFHQMLLDAGKQADKIVIITSDNSQSKEIKDFLVNISESILNYDVLIASPSLGTGIDITFADGAQLIDTVFGIFDPLINTHFDIDQQLSRVRHPKAVKVWVSPRKFYFECDSDVIKEYCIDSGLMADALTGYDKTGNAIYNKDDKILNLFADVTVLASASKNNLKKHFIDLKQHNGWTVNVIEKDESGCVQTTGNIRDAKIIIEKNYVNMICSATILTQAEYDNMSRNNSLTRDQFFAIERYRIERFYNEPVSPELVRMDSKGTCRKQIQMLVRFLSSHDVMVDRDSQQTERVSFDRENNLQKRDVLRNVLTTTGLVDDKGNFILEKEICSADLKKFALACVDQNHSFQRLFNLPLRKDLHTKPMIQLNSILKLIGLKTVEVRHTDDADKKRTFFHALDAGLYHQAMKYTLPKVKSPSDPFELMMEDETDDVVSRLKKSKVMAVN